MIATIRAFARSSSTLAAVVALVAAPSYGDAPATKPSPREAIAQAIAASMNEHEVPGVSIAVVNDYQLDWAEGFGVLKAGETSPVTPTTLFQAASISKPVAALAALRTVELGKLTLDEDVNHRLTSWHIPDSPLLSARSVTLQHLLSHSAGLDRARLCRLCQRPERAHAAASAGRFAAGQF